MTDPRRGMTWVHGFDNNSQLHPVHRSAVTMIGMRMVVYANKSAHYDFQFLHCKSTHYPRHTEHTLSEPVANPPRALENRRELHKLHKFNLDVCPPVRVRPGYFGFTGKLSRTSGGNTLFASTKHATDLDRVPKKSIT